MKMVLLCNCHWIGRATSFKLTFFVTAARKIRIEKQGATLLVIVSCSKKRLVLFWFALAYVGCILNYALFTLAAFRFHSWVWSILQGEKFMRNGQSRTCNYLPSLDSKILIFLSL